MGLRVPLGFSSLTACIYRKYIAKYGQNSFFDFYVPFLKFFGEGHLSRVKIIDNMTREHVNDRFKFKFTEEHDREKANFLRGGRVIIVMEDRKPVDA